MFTYNLDTERQYLVHSNAVYLNFVVKGNNEDERSGATITFERFGKLKDVMYDVHQNIRAHL